LRRMRKQIAKLKTAQESMDDKLNALRVEAEKTKEKARKKKTKKERAMTQLRDALSKNIVLERRILEEEAKRLAETKRTVEVTSKNQLDTNEPMEVVETTPTPLLAEKKGIAPTPTARIQIIERDLREYPALRPLIKKKVSVIPDVRRNLPPPELNEDMESRKVLIKRRKGLKGAEWNSSARWIIVHPYPKRRIYP